MKKLSVFLTLLLCFCIGTGVAEPLNTQPLYTYENSSSVSFLSYVDLLKSYSNYEYTLTALDGTLLSEPYARLSADSVGGGTVIKAASSQTTVTVESGSDQLEAVQTSAEGLLNLKGEVVLPVEYVYAKPLSEHWGIGYTAARVGKDEAYDLWMILYDVEDTVYAAFTSANIYNLDSAALVATLTPDQYRDFEADGEYLAIMDNDDNVTIYNADFEDVTEEYTAKQNAAEQTAAEPVKPDYFCDSETGLYGMKAADGTVIYPAEYSWVNVYNNYDGFPMYTFSIELPDGTEKYGIVSQDGKIIKEPDTSISSLYIMEVDDRYAMPYCTQNDEQYYGILDREGNMVVPIEYKNIRMQEGDDFAICEKADGMISIYSLAEGKMVLDGVSENDIYYDSDQQSILVTYQDTNKSTIFCNDGAVTEFPEGISVRYIDGSKGLYFSTTDADYNHSLVDNHGNVILKDYAHFEVSPSGSYMVALNESTNNCELFELNLDCSGKQQRHHPSKGWCFFCSSRSLGLSFSA